MRPGRQGYVHPADQQQVELRFPRDANGNPLPFRDPRENQRILVSNDGGPDADPFRGNNCADQSCAELENWYGNPQVSAPRYPEYVDGSPSKAGETDGIAKIEALTGAKFAYDGAGADGYKHLAETLKQAGHGAAAAIVVDWGDGSSHAFNAFNHEGKILWTDGQGGRVSEDTPLWPQAKHVWSVGMDADRNPLPGYEPLDAGQTRPEAIQSPRTPDTPDTPDTVQQAQSPDTRLPDQQQPDAGARDTAPTRAPEGDVPVQPDRPEMQATAGDPRNGQADRAAEPAVAEPTVAQQPDTRTEPVAQRSEPDTALPAPDSADAARTATDAGSSRPETQGSHDPAVEPEPLADTRSAGDEPTLGKVERETPDADVRDPRQPSEVPRPREDQPSPDVPRQREPERSPEPALPADPGRQPTHDQDHKWIDDEHTDATHNVPGGKGIGVGKVKDRDGYRQNADLPEDIKLTPEKVATILNTPPEDLGSSSKQRMKFDYEQHLTQRDEQGKIVRDENGNAVPLPQAELDAKLKQLRDEGEQSVGKTGGKISNGKFAGQIVKFSKEWAVQAGQRGYGYDPAAYEDGVYYDLRGYPDLTPYAHCMVDLGPEPKPVPGQDADPSDPVAWERDASQRMKDKAAKVEADQVDELGRPLTPDEQRAARALAQRTIVAGQVRDDDFDRANKAMRAAYGDQQGTLWDGQEGNAPNGWTWHHVPTNPGEPRKMILVPRAAHEGARHYGGIATKTATPSLVDTTPTLGYQHHVPGDRVEVPIGHSQNPAVAFNPHPIGLSDNGGIYKADTVTLPANPVGEILSWDAVMARRETESAQSLLAGDSPGAGGDGGGGSPP